MKILIPIILVFFMMQSCGGNSNDLADDEQFINNEGLEDINPAEEPGEEFEPEPEPEQDLDSEPEPEPEPEPELEITL
jgi:hypothetical protein